MQLSTWIDYNNSSLSEEKTHKKREKVQTVCGYKI